MKKFITVLLIAMMCLSLTACGGNDAGQTDAGQEDVVQNESGREAAAEFAYEMVEGEEIVVESLIFNEDVTVSGSNGQVSFMNCEFNGDIIHSGEGRATVYLDGDCVVNGTAKMDNGIQEADFWESAFPKYFTDIPLNVVLNDCYGGVVVGGAIDITFDGETQSIENCEMFWQDNDLVPYEGQEANTHYVFQWWENGEKVVLTYAENA